MATKNAKQTVKPTAKIAKPAPARKPFYQRKAFLWPVGVVLGLLVVGFLAFELSPWPGAIVVRIVFSSGDRKKLAALEKYTPRAPIAIMVNEQYKSGDQHALLDVYIPQSAQHAGKTLPVVVWTHGGAWVSGNKADDEPYFKLIAAQGFIVVSLNYTLAPERTYPTQIFELNAAHAYLLANAARFHINPNKIFLAGDSAGSQLSSQMAALITNPAYAKTVGIAPALRPSQLAGVALFCGIYQMKGLTEADPNLPKFISWGDNQVLWAYSGTRNNASPRVQQMSPYFYVTSAFPATFISGGNGDPLTNPQSVPLANKLSTMHVPVTTLFYPANHQPSLPHEYQFNLDNADGQNALNQLLAFFQKH